MPTIYCTFKQSVGWRVVFATLETTPTIRIVKLNGVKLLCLPTLAKFRGGRFCNPLTVVLAYVREKLPRLGLRFQNPDKELSMNITIWTRHDGYHVPGQTIEVSSISDDASCHLAFMHLRKGSVANLQDSTLKPAKAGDIFVLDDGGDERCYELSFDPVSHEAVFTKVQFGSV